MYPRLSALLLASTTASFVACDSPATSAPPDATSVPDGAPSLGLFTVETHARDGSGGAALVAHQGAAGWALASEGERGVFTFSPTNEIVVLAVVCDQPSASTATVSLIYTTAAVGRGEARCERVPSATITVSAAPGSALVSVGHMRARARGSTAPSTEVSIQYDPGTRDVVGSTPTRILIRRGVPLPPAAPVVLDVGADGTDLEPIALRVPAIDEDETAAATYSFYTAGGTRVVFDTTTPVALRGVPSTAIVQGDRHGLVIRAERMLGSVLTSRNVSVVGSDLRSLEALSYPLGIAAAEALWDRRSGGPLRIRWQGGPDGERGIGLWQVHQGRLRNWSIGFALDWVAATGAITGDWTAPDLSTIPGWKSEWSLDPTAASTGWQVGISAASSSGGMLLNRSAYWSDSLLWPEL